MVKYYFFSIVLFYCFFTIIACDFISINRPPNNAIQDSLVYKTISVSKIDDECQLEEKTDCTKASLTYIKAIEGIKLPSIQQLNQSIAQTIAKEIDTTTIPSILDSFINYYQSYQQEVNFMPSAPWFKEVTQSVVYNKYPYFSIQILDSEYMGGAHGNYTHSFLNYHTSQGYLIDKPSIFRANYETSLDSIGLVFFKVQQSIPLHTSLSDAGFWFENEKFYLNDNFSIQQDGLLFLYNPYEIAPFAMGMTEVFIPYAAIQSLLKPDFKKQMGL